MICSRSRYLARHQDLHKAVGRILFRFGNENFICSGTLVEGAHDRAIIATAAHCIFDEKKKTFPDHVMFIPGQDDGEGDSSNFDCTDDPHGCFYPTFGVLPDEYATSNSGIRYQYDYGFYVAPDADPGYGNGPDRETYGGKDYKSLKPMPISFDGLKHGASTYIFGYPGARDPKFMYTEGSSLPSPITNGGSYVECSGLSGGASGGPWTQSDVSTGTMVVASVSSWGWGTGDPGIGASPYDDGGAQCVYEAAVSADLDGGDIIARCPK